MDMYEVAAPDLLPQQLSDVLRFEATEPTNGIFGSVLDPNPEARVYAGCEFSLPHESGARTRIVFRSAKVTPTKAGLFVTLWKRDESGNTRPYTKPDAIDEFWISAEKEHGYGLFKFPAEVLEDVGVLKSATKPGKRGFRLYTPWDENLNSSASKAWAWQRKFFTVLER